LNIPKGISARDLIRALEADGFVHVRMSGSHRRFKHADGHAATVSCHKESDTLPIGTLRSIMLVQARWTENDLRRLHLIQ
jgi:predicted RNA binding protein YcfA (HicA-like mRNA interferase family)